MKQSRPARTWLRIALLLVIFYPVVTPATSMTLEEARRLTWDPATRAAGIAALRDLVAAAPTARPARLELARVLTWDRSTRDEGITRLRDMATQTPEDPQVAESLAEVLYWRETTRSEAIEMLRALVRDHPEQVSAQLILAEVLSWNRASRPESIGLYRKVLAHDPSSTPARLGLARVLSWTGDLHSARTLYAGTPSALPDDEDARLGLAEIERWSGRPRAALRTLERAQPSTRDPAAALQRAQAYEDLGRPAKALSQYEQVLAVSPESETARLGAARARRRLAPRVEFGTAGSTESGASRTSKVRIVEVPVTYSYHPGASDVTITAGAGHAWYDNRRGTTEAIFGGLGLTAALGHHLIIDTSARFHDFEEADGETTGDIALKFSPADRISIRVSASRSLLTDSRLAAAGERIGGVFYGPVVRDEISVGFSLRPARRWDTFVRLATGNHDGDNVADNDRDAIYGGFGRTFRPGRHQLRLGYDLTWLSYDLDLSGFPPSDLGGDGITTPGVGGYFSPDDFLNQMGRIDVVWNLSGRFHVMYGGGAGRQSVDTLGGDDDRTSSDAYLGVSWRFGSGWTLRARATYQDVAAAFDRTRLRLFLAHRF
ncbi:MAG: tetratricopeptide repeat protein [Acidobacteriota bacterium]